MKFCDGCVSATGLAATTSEETRFTLPLTVSLLRTTCVVCSVILHFLLQIALVRLYVVALLFLSLRQPQCETRSHPDVETQALASREPDLCTRYFRVAWAVVPAHLLPLIL